MVKCHSMSLNNYHNDVINHKIKSNVCCFGLAYFLLVFFNNMYTVYSVLQNRTQMCMPYRLVSVCVLKEGKA